jgi:DNA-binding transcriptional regulator YiaG
MLAQMAQGCVNANGGSMTTRQALQLTEARRLLRSGEARAIRQAAGLSLEEVARVCGVTPGAVSRWETSNRRPTGDAAVQFASLLAKIRDAQPPAGDRRDLVRGQG